DHPMMWIGLALLLEERGELGTAREAYRAALEVGAHPEAQLGLASVSGRDGEGEGGGEEGLTQALMAHNQRPAHVYGGVLLAQKLLWVARQPAAALRVLDALEEVALAKHKKAEAVVQATRARARAALGLSPLLPSSSSSSLLLTARAAAARGEWGEMAVALLALEGGGGGRGDREEEKEVASRCVVKTLGLLAQGDATPQLQALRAILGETEKEQEKGEEGKREKGMKEKGACLQAICKEAESMQDPEAPPSLASYPEVLQLFPSSLSVLALCASRTHSSLPPSSSAFSLPALLDALSSGGSISSSPPSTSSPPPSFSTVEDLAVAATRISGSGPGGMGRGGGGQTLWGRTTSKGLPLEWEDAIGRCRRAAAAGEWEKASGEYCAVLGRVKEGWVDGWREWAEVVLKWKGGAAAKKIWRFVLREMGSVLSPVGKAAIHIRLASLLYEEGGAEEGMEELGEAAKANPGKGDAAAFWLRGMLWKREGGREGGREKQVVQSWGKAREARPTCGLLRRLTGGEGGREGGE
ncbi:Hypothetical protein NocV09_12100010, partial [Nannochloropsis oceanica]